MKYTYGFIGCGNMGGALARALSRKTKNIVLSDPDTAKRDALAEKIGADVSDNAGIVSGCDAIFLAVKPQMLRTVLSPISASIVKKRPLIISMAAGVTVEKIGDLLGKDVPVIRIMPNTPVAVGAGLILYASNEYVGKEDLDRFLSDMEFAGTLDKIDEEKIDAASAVTGCGPAYAYMMIDALADGAVTAGIPRDTAIRYAAAMLLGSAKTVLETGEHPDKLKDNVCSPAGSTIEGVRVLEERGFRASVIDAVIAAYKRTKELGK